MFNFNYTKQPVVSDASLSNASLDYLATSSLKSYLVRQAVDHIKTYGIDQENPISTKAVDLVNEVLGLKSSSCKAFNEFRTDNMRLWFQSKTILSAELTYLIGICYYLCVPEARTQKNSEEQIAAWMKLIVPQRKFEFAVEALRMLEVNINNISVSIAGNTVQLFNFKKLNTLVVNKVDKNKLIKVHFKKIPKNNLIYANFNGVCHHLTRYFLLSMLDSRNSFLSKVKSDAYINSLKVTKQPCDIDDIENSCRVTSLGLQSPRFNNKLTFVQNFTVGNGIDLNEPTFGHGVILALMLMLKNKVKQMYIEIMSLDHAMGCVVVQSGALFKVFIYDPNSYSGYFAFNLEKIALDEVMNLASLNAGNKEILDEINHLIYFENKYMPYLYARKANKLILTFKCYVNVQIKEHNSLLVKYPLLLKNNISKNYIGSLVGKYNNGVKNLLRAGIVGNNSLLIKIACQVGDKYPEAIIHAVKVYLSLADLTLVMDSFKSSEYNYRDPVDGNPLEAGVKYRCHITVISLLCSRFIDPQPAIDFIDSNALFRMEHEDINILNILKIYNIRYLAHLKKETDLAAKLI